MSEIVNFGSEHKKRPTASSAGLERRIAPGNFLILVIPRVGRRGAPTPFSWISLVSLYFLIWLPITPPTAAPPTVPAALPPVSTAPAAPPMAAPAAVLRSRADMLEQAAVLAISATTPAIF